MRTLCFVIVCKISLHFCQSLIVLALSGICFIISVATPWAYMSQHYIGAGIDISKNHGYYPSVVCPSLSKGVFAKSMEENKVWRDKVGFPCVDLCDMGEKACDSVYETSL